MSPSDLLNCIILCTFITLLFCDDNDECASMATLSGIELYKPTDGNEYTQASQQWAYPSYGADRMQPSLILYPKSDTDIFNALSFSELCAYKVAIRSGGYQYSALSSCNSHSSIGKCMQIDMKYYDKLALFTGNDTIQVEPGVKLGPFNAYLDAHNYFLPSGNAPHIGIGGHILTGGDGYLSKTHGLLADYVIGFDLILSNATKLTNVSTVHCSDLYWAVLGGGPGSFGIVTKYELDISRTHNTVGMGFSYVFQWNKELLFAFGDLYIEMHSQHALHYLQNEQIGSVQLQFVYSFALQQYIIKLSWIDIGSEDSHFLSKLFLDKAKQLRIEPLSADELHKPISALLMHEAFTNNEFGIQNMAPLPYEMSSYGALHNLDDEFIDLLIDRIELITRKYGGENGLFSESGMAVNILFQSYGGVHGQIYKNDPLMRKTAYSYRQQLLALPVCVFYDIGIEAESKRMTQKWLSDTFEILRLTAPYHYGEHDLRHVSFTFGDLEIENVWQYYYKNETVFRKLKRVKFAYDPSDLFHNSFTVPLPSANAKNDEKDDL